MSYIRAIAAVAGYSLYRPEVDNDSVDLGIVSRGGTGKIFSPRLEVQLKCTSRGILDENYIKYPLNLTYQERLPIRGTGDLVKQDNHFILKNPQNLQIEKI
ncbi:MULTISPECIES: DUF4365 domain-containing protein [unclassified Nostoc]|uniref:DUF4365 domain-containing protein n=1 Tax=unclassified Nostoc TaxID=2593658 RepID=UPI002118C77F|nr:MULTISPECIES: DUF4365 domain-containing protein [unclassified Nostoc]